MSARQLPLVAQLIRKHRVSAGFSQEELAERSGVSARAVSDLERGLRATPRLETLRMLADALPMSETDRTALFSAARLGEAAPDDLTPEPTGFRPTMLPLRLQPLPSVVTRLVGQDELVDRLTLLAHGDEHRLITLIGPGGVGKTHVCIEVAHRVAGRYLDGVAFVDLSALQRSDQVPAAIASALGFDTGGGQSAFEPVGGALRHRSLLLVLDNFEHVVDAAPLVSEIFSTCAHVTILVTSRVRLRLRGEQVLTIAPLAVPPAPADAADKRNDGIEQFPAVRLFLERSQEADASFTIDERQLATIGEICRKLDGLPLAIELAASRISVYSPETLLERLNRRLPALVGGRRDAPTRQQTLAAAIGWSYELLDPDVQRFLRRLAVFAGGWTLDAAERVAAEPGDDSAAMIETLIDHSLIRLQRGGSDVDRYTMLETVREFAESALFTSGETSSIRRRHRDWCLELSERADREFANHLNDQVWYTRLDTELANLRVAIAYMREIEDGSGMLLCIRHLLFYWNDRPYFRDLSVWLDWAVEHSANEPPEVMVQIQGTRAFLAASLGDHDLARELVQSMLTFVELAPTPAILCQACNIQGVCFEYAGDSENAAATYARGVAACEECGSPHAVEAKREVADKWILTGNINAAVELLDECLAISRAMGDETQVAHALGLRALAALAQNDLARSAVWFNEYLELALAYRIDRDALGAIAGMAALALAIDKPIVAARLLGAVESARQSVGVARIFNQLYADRTMSEAREALGAERLAAALQEGASMSYDEAVGVARDVAAFAMAEHSEGSPA